MAELSGLPALDVDPVGFGARASLLQTQAQQANQNLQTRTALAPLEIEQQKNETKLQSMNTGNAVLAQVAKDTQAADPADRPAAWDAGMKKALESGYSQAGQFVGHYRDDLADRVASSYGGQSNAPPPLDPGIRNTIASSPLPQIQTALANSNKIIASFHNVKDQQSWNDEIAFLKQNGMDPAKILGGTDYSPLNYAAAHRYVNDILTPQRDAMLARVASVQVGMPDVPPAGTVEKVGNTLLSYGPGGTNLKTLFTDPRYQYKGPAETGGPPVSYNETTGQSSPIGGQNDPYAAFAARMIPTENSTGNAGAKNPLSTASGNGQFLEGSWLSLVNQVKPAWADGLNRQQILDKRDVPAIATDMTALQARQNAPVLAQAGAPVTTTTLALAHRLGPRDALKVLNAAPNTPLTSLLSKQVITANPDMANATAGSYMSGLASKVGNDPISSLGGNIGGSVPGDATKHGADYLATIPDKALASEVKAVVEGRMQQPTSFFLKTPQGQALMRAAAQYDPAFDLSLYQSRVAAQTDLAKGKMGQNVTSFNTAIGHLGVMDDAIDRLENSSFPAINTAVNIWHNITGDARVQQFNVARNAVVAELTRAFRGTGGNASDIQEWEKTLDAANSPEQLHAAVRSAVDLLNSRISATSDQYSRAMRLQVDPGNLLSPNARATLARLQTDGASSAGGTKPQSFIEGKVYSDKSGNKARYQDGKWVPV